MRYLKNTFVFILVLMLLLSISFSASSLVLPVYREIGTEAIEDFLLSSGSERFYSFEMTEQGQALIWIENKQDGWKGTVTIHPSNNQKTELASAKINKAGELTLLLVKDLEPGSYKVVIKFDSADKDLESDMLSYEISVVPLTPSAVPERQKGNVATVSKAKEIICVVGDTYYVKLYDGEAKAALQHKKVEKHDYYLPVLYGSTKESVAYYVSTTQRIVKYEGDEEIHPEEGRFYHAMGTYEDRFKKDYVVNDSDLPLFLVEGDTFEYNRVDLIGSTFGSDSILKQMQRQEQLQNSDWDFFLCIKFFFIDHWLISIIVAIIVAIVLYQVISDRRYKKANAHNRTSSSSYSGSSYSSTTSTADTIDMDIANRIAANSHNPNYNPESPTSINDLSSGD